MLTKRNLMAAAFLGLLASPLPAQIILGGGTVGDRAEDARRRAEEVRRRTAMDSVWRRTDRGSRKIPPGQLPPRGMCRVWIDGVPPGQQPPVTDCATAERTRTVNSRVIYGDRESFPGNGKGKFKDRKVDREAARGCSVRDGVVVGGRVINVCRDNADDRFEDQDRGGHDKLSKAERKAAKAARKGHRGRG